MTDRLPDTEEKRSLDTFQAMTARDFDLELFADKIEADFMVSAPRDLKDSVLRAASRPEVQIEIRARELPKRMQLFLYSLKVGTAVLGALLLLSAAPDLTSISPPAVPIRQEMKMRESAWRLEEANDKLSGYLRQLSNDIFSQWR